MRTPPRLVVDVESLDDPDLQLIMIGRPGQDFDSILQDATAIPYDGWLVFGQPRTVPADDDATP